MWTGGRREKLVLKALLTLLLALPKPPESQMSNLDGSLFIFFFFHPASPLLRRCRHVVCPAWRCEGRESWEESLQHMCFPVLLFVGC